MFEKFIVPVVVGATAAVVGACAYVGGRIKKLTDRFDRSVSDLKDISEKEISEELLRKAVDEAADSKMERYAREVHNEVLDEYKAALRKEIRVVIDTEAKTIKDKAQDEIERQISNIDISDMKRRVRERAEDKVVDKFDGQLDDILEKFNDKLGGVAKVYSEIEGVIRGVKASNEKKISFSLD